jgi:hypothetical protein
MFMDVIKTLRLMLVINRLFMYVYEPLVALDLIQLQVFSIFIIKRYFSQL